MPVTAEDTIERHDPRSSGDGSRGRPPSTSVSGPLTHLLLRMHFYVGVLVGPFLLIAAVSGALYALAPAAEQVVYRDQLSATSPTQDVPLADQVATAGALHTTLPVTGVVPGADGATTRVLFSDPSLPSSSFSRVVFVDPSTGEARGDTVQYGSGQSLPLRTWISELHRSLHLGEPGRVYSELAASWLAPLAVGGLVLWWIRRRQERLRQERRRQPGRAPMLRAGGPTEGRARTRTRHAVAGTWAVVGLLFLSATGLSWSQYAGANIGDLRTAMNWSTPALATGVPAGASAAAGHEDHEAAGHEAHAVAGHEEHAQHTADEHAAALAGDGGGDHSGASLGGRGVGSGFDVAVATARSAGLSDPMQLTPPAAESAPWLVNETRRSWTVGADSVSVDARTGQVVERIDFADYPLAAKLTDWGIRGHMGFLFGLPNQILLAALATVLVGIICRGYAMWWARRPGPGRPPTRGALLELARRRPLVTAVAVLVVAAIGWAAPLLGISLVGFLVLDAALSRIPRRAASSGRAGASRGGAGASSGRAS